MCVFEFCVFFSVSLFCFAFFHLLSCVVFLLFVCSIFVRDFVICCMCFSRCCSCCFCVVVHVDHGFLLNDVFVLCGFLVVYHVQTGSSIK